MSNYACIKNNVVQDVLFFEENATAELFEEVKENFSYDELVEFNNLNIEPEFLYIEENFYIEEGKKAFRLDEPNPDRMAPPATAEEIAAKEAELAAVLAAAQAEAAAVLAAAQAAAEALLPVQAL